MLLLPVIQVIKLLTLWYYCLRILFVPSVENFIIYFVNKNETFSSLAHLTVKIVFLIQDSGVIICKCIVFYSLHYINCLNLKKKNCLVRILWHISGSLVHTSVQQNIISKTQHWILLLTAVNW